MPSSKVIGGPFDKGVLNQLNLRSDIFSKKEGRTDQNIEYLNSKTGWVKLTSSVNAGGSSALASKYVFIGGTKGRFGDNTYSNFSNGLGFRPMPGITGVQIRAINRFGVLKEATITFNCWDVAQLQELELLYMRPGFSALLEWGHSVYYKGPGNFITTPSTVATMFSEGTTKEGLYKEINKLKQDSGYNYDGIFGFIKNFSWKYRQDGGYDCTTTLISIGEIIESLTIDVGTGTFPGNEEEEGKVASPTMIEQVFKTIIEKSTTDGIGDVYETLKTKHKSFIENYEKINGVSGLYISQKAVTVTTPVDDKSATKSPDKFVYLRLDSFCALVNTILPCDKDKKSVIKMNTQMAKIGEDSDIPLCRFRTYDFHTSSDPGVCLLVTPSTKKWASGQLYPGIIESLRSVIGGTSSDEILNIWVNVNVLGEAITSLVNTPDKGSRTLVKLFEGILPKLNDVMGGDYNDLALHYEEDKFTYYIVDRKIRASESEDDTPVLNITGLKSTVTNFDFTTKLSPALSTMVAVSAQNNGSDVGVEAEALFRWNEGLTDRILGNKFINTTADTSTKESVEAERKKQQSERYNKTFAALKEFYIGNKYDPEKFSAAKVDYADFTKTYLQTYTEESATSGTKAGPAGIVPFEVGISMDGIAGIKIGQAFRINKGIMPAKYDEVLGFIVTGIEHTIGGNRWSTQLKAQTIVLKPGDRVATSPEFTPSTPSDGVNPDEETGIKPKPSKTPPAALVQAMRDYGIKDPKERAHFLAQCAHESGGFAWTKEFASGAAYEGRKDLGNTETGDGKRFKGRGYIQITGRANYTKYNQYLVSKGITDDVVTNPGLVATKFAADSACYWWKFLSRNITALALAGTADGNVRKVSKRVNGGDPANGLADRIGRFKGYWAELSKDSSKYA
jgi:putative chitinase